MLTGGCDKVIKFINLPNFDISTTRCDGEGNFQPCLAQPLVQEIVVGNDILMGAIHSNDSVVYTCDNDDPNRF